MRVGTQDTQIPPKQLVSPQRGVPVPRCPVLTCPGAWLLPRVTVGDALLRSSALHRARPPAGPRAPAEACALTTTRTFGRLCVRWICNRASRTRKGSGQGQEKPCWQWGRIVTRHNKPSVTPWFSSNWIVCGQMQGRKQTDPGLGGVGEPCWNGEGRDSQCWV